MHCLTLPYDISQFYLLERCTSFRFLLFLLLRRCIPLLCLLPSVIYPVLSLHTWFCFFTSAPYCGVSHFCTVFISYFFHFYPCAPIPVPLLTSSFSYSYSSVSFLCLFHFFLSPCHPGSNLKLKQLYWLLLTSPRNKPLLCNNQSVCCLALFLDCLTLEGD